MRSPTLLSSLTLAALLAAAAVPASAQDGHAVYRAQVLGERIAVNTTPAGTEQRLMPGPQGRYLVYLGRSVEQAVAEARASGEEPVWTTAPVARTQVVDGFEAYQRHLGLASRHTARAATDVAQHEAPTLR